MEMKVEMKRHGKIQSDMEVARLYKLLTYCLHMTYDIYVPTYIVVWLCVFAKSSDACMRKHRQRHHRSSKLATQLDGLSPFFRHPENTEI